MSDLRLTLVEHLSELRKRLVISIIAIIVGSVLCYNFIEEIIQFIIKPAEGVEFIYLSPPELFVAYIKISLVLGLIIALPVVLFQIWMFIQPGLNKKEKRYAVLIMSMAVIFFLFGVIFAYFVIIPMAIRFFLNMTVSEVEPLFSFTNYVGFISSLIVSFGLVFELPLVVVLLTQLGFATPDKFKKYRKVVILGVVILAAILTPPDIVSQIMMTIPMLLLYEISIIISSVIYKRKEESREKNE